VGCATRLYARLACKPRYTMALPFVRQPPGPARESSHVLPRSSACLGLARFHLHQLTCFSNREFITDSTHFHVPTLVPLITLSSQGVPDVPVVPTYLGWIALSGIGGTRRLSQMSQCAWGCLGVMGFVGRPCARLGILSSGGAFVQRADGHRHNPFSPRQRRGFITALHQIYLVQPCLSVRPHASPTP
jgi:hypothetical protein